MTERWVLNASPLIVLARVGQEHLFHTLADKVVVPRAVAVEIEAGPADDPARQVIAGGHFDCRGRLCAGSLGLRSGSRRDGSAFVCIEEARGRFLVKGRHTGDFGGVYLHRGPSLMECLTPWLVVREAGRYK